MIHKIRVILDASENVFRDIEIRDKHTLWNLHEAIQNAFSLPKDEMSVFNIFDEEGTVIKNIHLEDMSDEGDGETMADYYIDEIFAETGDKVQFQYGFIELWNFFCELIQTSEAKKAVKYPNISYRFGKLPLKPPAPKSETRAADHYEEDFMLDDDGFDDDFEDDYFSDDN